MLNKQDFERVINEHEGNKIFAAALRMAGRANVTLIHFLTQYVQFNSIFGAGVANLAGEIARRQDVFRDPNDPIYIIGDRSCNVAATIFFAAIDEFGRKKNHRSMAQDTLRESARCLKIATDHPGALSCLHGTSTAMRAVADSYCLNRTASEADLFFGIGFHIGSELLADDEFNILDQYLKQQHHQLVSHLQAKKSYVWVAVHTTVEADHFDAAVESGNEALKFYTGDRGQAKAWILQGFRHFNDVQTQFMRSLCPALSQHVDTFEQRATA